MQESIQHNISGKQEKNRHNVYGMQETIQNHVSGMQEQILQTVYGNARKKPTECFRNAWNTDGIFKECK